MKISIFGIVLLSTIPYCGAIIYAHKYDNGCDGGAYELDGNWYCENSVQAVTYTGFQQTGSYSRVTSMNDGVCSSEPQSFNSTLGSFGKGNDISWHLRGPLQLKQIAYYTLPAFSVKQRNVKPTFHERRHGHEAFHDRSSRRDNEQISEIDKRHVVEVQKRAVCDPVTVVFGTVTASWLNLWNGVTNVPSSVCYHSTTTTSPIPTSLQYLSAVVDAGELTTTTVEASLKTHASSSLIKGDIKPTTTATPLPATFSSTDVRGGTTTITYTVVYASTRTSKIKGTTAATPISASAQSLSLTLLSSASPLASSELPATAPSLSGLSAGSTSQIQPSSSTTSASENSTNFVSPSVPTTLLSLKASTSMMSQSSKLSESSILLGGTLTTTTLSNAAISSPESVSYPQGTSTPNIAMGTFGRQAYYNADMKDSTGFTFLNHNGGQGSGVWDLEFGNSLSYASADGKSGSASPQVFDGYLEDGHELVIMSDKECGSDDICGYSRPGTVAHQGFYDSESLFLLDFSMPATHRKGWNMDMPAIWALNAQIPRTLQYGNAECSCWSSGCGEMDLFEVLDAGNPRMKASWHGDDDSAGSSYWFERPQSSQKAGVLMSEGDAAVTIFFIPNDADFSQILDADTVSGWISSAANNGTLFTLS